MLYFKIPIYTYFTIKTEAELHLWKCLQLVLSILHCIAWLRLVVRSERMAHEGVWMNQKLEERCKEIVYLFKVTCIEIEDLLRNHM